MINMVKFLIILVLKQTDSQVVLTRKLLEEWYPKGLDGLLRIDLSDKKITSIGPQTFNGLKSLKYLWLNIWLNNNEITSISSQTFYDLTNLIDLHLHQNKITTIYSKAFDGLTNLSYLTYIYNITD